MSHSKRNTSLAFFTSHERALLRSSWGTQSTRLSRDSFLPFGYCRLCLLPSRDPVVCGSGNHQSNAKVHLFCRECALNDLVQQRKEIKRLEKEKDVAKEERIEEGQRLQEEKRQKEVERFERDMGGFGFERDVKDGKRKREAEEMHGREDQEQKEKKIKVDGGRESSFWIPSVSTKDSKSDTYETGVKAKLKLHPLCPSSTPEDKHMYSLKSLVTVRFLEGDNENGRKERSWICPSCKKELTNTSKPMLGTADGCGHVVCGSCCARFARDQDRIQCYVCEANLAVRRDNGNKQEKNSKVGQQVEISCEGTGFAGGGSNVTKKNGVAFQC